MAGVWGTRSAAATSDKALAGNPMLLTLQLQTVSGPFRTGDPLSAVPWIGVMPRTDERSQAMHAKEHGFRDKSDNVLMVMRSEQPAGSAFATSLPR